MNLETLKALGKPREGLLVTDLADFPEHDFDDDLCGCLDCITETCKRLSEREADSDWFMQEGEWYCVND